MLPAVSLKAHWLPLLAGVLLPLAFAPLNFSLLALFVPLVLYVRWEGVPPRQAFKDGYWFGLGFFGVGVSWIFVSIHDMGDLPLGLAILLTGVFIAFLSLFPATQGLLAARLFPQPGWKRSVLAMPALWVAWEGLRGWVFTGFPWLYLGYSQLGGPLESFAPLLGVLGVSLAVASGSGMLLCAWRATDWWQRGGWLIGAVSLGGIGLALHHYPWTQSNGSPLSVALVQVAIPQTVRWQPQRRQESVRRYLDLSRRHWGTQIIVWPENALPVFYHEAANFLDELAREAKERGTELLIGLPVMDLDRDRYYNGLVSLPGGEIYRKQQLVPFTEFLPFKNWLGRLITFLQIPMSDFSPGSSQQPPLTVANRRVGVTICYEAAFPQTVAAALPDADLLVNISNDGWFGRSLAPHQHLQMAQMRALETGRFLLRGANTGISALIDPYGQVIRRSSQFEDDVVTGEVLPMTGSTPYVILGDRVLWTLLILLLVAAYRSSNCGSG